MFLALTIAVIVTFGLTPEQWWSLSERTKLNKISGTLRSAWGKAWCVEKGVLPVDKDMMRAIDRGIMSWEANVMECIGYDTKLMQKLTKA